jgi:hypothetical protein
MFCLRTTLHMRINNGSLVIDVKRKVKYKIHVAVMLLFHIVQTNYPYESQIIFKALFHRPELSGATIASTSQFRAPSMLFLLINLTISIGCNVQMLSGDEVRSKW